MKSMVGTAQMHLCPPYRLLYFPVNTALRFSMNACTASR